MASSKMGIMALLFAAAVASVSAAHGGPYPYKYYAYMKGKFEVPPLVTKTWGFGYVEWNATDILVSVELHNADGITAVHVHNGTMGVNGPVVIPVAGFMMPGTEMPQPVSGDFETYVMLKTADYPWLPEFLSMGMGYFNAHSVANPGGEVRGQLYVAQMPEEMMPPPMPSGETIASVAMEYPELSTFVAAVSAAPEILAGATDPSTVATVLAPTNAAFEAALAALGLPLEDLVGDTETLTGVLAYHILTSVVLSAGVPAPPGADVTTFLEGETVFAEADMGMIMFNEVASIVTADIMVNGGVSVIHIIDAVLLPSYLRPSSPPMMPETIASVAGNYPELSTFLAAASASPAILAAATDPSTAVTVLAPTNTAFEVALAALGLDVSALVGNTELLTQVLSYHVLTSVIPASGVPMTPTDVPTLLGPTVSALSMDGVVTFTDAIGGVATVETADIMVNGGTSIIHTISAVLLPPGLGK